MGKGVRVLPPFVVAIVNESCILRAKVSSGNTCDTSGHQLLSVPLEIHDDDHPPKTSAAAAAPWWAHALPVRCAVYSPNILADEHPPGISWDAELVFEGLTSLFIGSVTERGEVGAFNFSLEELFASGSAAAVALAMNGSSVATCANATATTAAGSIQRARGAAHTHTAISEPFNCSVAAATAAAGSDPDSPGLQRHPDTGEYMFNVLVYLRLHRMRDRSRGAFNSPHSQELVKKIALLMLEISDINATRMSPDQPPEEDNHDDVELKALQKDHWMTLRTIMLAARERYPLDYRLCIYDPSQHQHPHATAASPRASMSASKLLMEEERRHNEAFLKFLRAHTPKFIIRSKLKQQKASSTAGGVGGGSGGGGGGTPSSPIGVSSSIPATPTAMSPTILTPTHALNAMKKHSIKNKDDKEFAPSFPTAAGAGVFADSTAAPTTLIEDDYLIRLPASQTTNSCPCTKRGSPGEAFFIKTVTDALKDGDRSLHSLLAQLSTIPAFRECSGNSYSCLMDWLRNHTDRFEWTNYPRMISIKKQQQQHTPKDDCGAVSLAAVDGTVAEN